MIILIVSCIYVVSVLAAVLITYFCTKKATKKSSEKQFAEYCDIMQKRSSIKSYTSKIETLKIRDTLYPFMNEKEIKDIIIHKISNLLLPYIKISYQNNSYEYNKTFPSFHPYELYVTGEIDVLNTEEYN